MSSRQQETAISRQATKLPQFPARKSLTSVGQSPARRTRVDSLPGVPPARSPTGRHDPSPWGRTGAEKLQDLGKRKDVDPSNHNSFDDDADGVEGFESPQMAKARAQVARDEVLSYMHHRRYQRKDTGERVSAHVEPRDTSFDDFDGDDDRDRSTKHSARDRSVKHSAREPPTPDSGRDPTRLLHRVQQALDRWPPGRHATQQNSFGDNDVRPSSVDQSPTRHDHSFPEQARDMPTGPDASSGVLGRMRDCVATGELRMIVSRVSQGSEGRSGATLAAGSDHVLRRASLSEDAFDAFKRELAARVIQTHWRRWQDWKAKLRREAEERILQQLLADDSGLSLQLLLSGGSTGGARGSAMACSFTHESPNAAEVVAPSRPQVNTRRPASAAVPTSYSNSVTQPARSNQPSRPNQPRRAVGSGGGGLGRLMASHGGADEGRLVPMRPASAAPTTAMSRGRSPVHGERTAVLPAPSPGRGGRIGSGRPRCEGGLLRGRSFDSDDLNGDGMANPDGVSIQPSRKHTGGHAVYTFVATPTKRTAADPPPAESAILQDSFVVKSQAHVDSAEPVTANRSSHASYDRSEEVCIAAADSAAELHPEDAAAEPSQDLHKLPIVKPIPSQPAPAPSPQTQPSLDADTNPAMASPALSMGTERSSRDSTLGIVSPFTSVIMTSSHVRPHSQSATTASRPSDLLPPAHPQSQEHRPLEVNSEAMDSTRRNVGPHEPHGVTAQQRLTTETELQDQAQQQQQQLPCETAGEPELASPPKSPGAPRGPPALQPDLSPSPQRQNRMQALQRLKLQGSLRGTLQSGGSVISRQPSGPTQLAAQAPAQHQPSAADVSQELVAHRGHMAERQRRQPVGTIAPPDEPQQSRGQRKVRQDEVDDWEGKLNKVQQQQQQQDRELCHEQGGLMGNGRQLRQQQHEHSEGDPRGRRNLFDRGHPSRQQLNNHHNPQVPDLSEEASLRALHEPSAASNQRRPSGSSPRLQPPLQDPNATTPRRWSQNAGHQGTAPSQLAIVVHADRVPQQLQTRDAALAKSHPGDYARSADALAANAGSHITDSRVSQGTIDHLQLDGPCPARAASATAVEGVRSRSASEAGVTHQEKITLGGDEDSLAQIVGVRSQHREPKQIQERVAAREDAATSRAWSERPGTAGVVNPNHRTREQQLKERSLERDAQGNADNTTVGESGNTGVAINVRAGLDDAGFRNSERSHRGSKHSHGKGTVHGSELPRAITSEQDNPSTGGKHGRCSGRGSLSCRKEVFSGVYETSDSDLQVMVEDSLTAQKMSSILKYLDEVEMQAEQEATCAAIAPALLATEPSAAAAVAAATTFLPGGVITQPNQRGAGSARGGGGGNGGGGNARRYDSSAGAGTSHATRQVSCSSRPGTAHTAVSLGQQRSQAALSDSGTGYHQSRNRRSHRSAARSMTGDEGEETCGEVDPEVEEDLGYDNDDDDAVSVATRSTVAGVTNRPAFLAESVYENVRTKIRRLQDDIKQRDARINELVQEVEAMQSAQRTCMLDADARLTEMLAAQRSEYEAAVSRHMAFVDRLLADKEALSRRTQQLSEQIKAADERQERAISKLKEGWAIELKRQKESWAAAEKQRRETWMQSKAAEIKDVTVKGLEGEVQKLLTRHRAELSAAQKAAADEAKRHLDTYVAQNEVAVRQVKERMAREAEEAVEKERGAAATRLREVSERYEQQLQTQRMRLVADADLRLEQLEQARKEDRKRYEEALAAAKEAGEARLKDAEEDWRREKEAVRKAHEKQIEALREQYETGQEGWRAAMAERARKEVSERVVAIREKLLQERNEEVQAVMTRLEAEHATAVEALKEDFRRREEAAASRAASALKEARRAEAKMAERFRNAGVSAKAAEERLATSEVTVNDLRRELEARNNTIRWLESQVSAAKGDAAARERDVRSLGAEKAAVAAEVAAAVARDKQQVEARLAQAQQEVQELRSRHSAEMAAVEARVRATLARKDEVINSLKEQLAVMAAELRSTQEVLREQQEELGSELEGGGGNSATAGRGMYGEACGGRRGGRH